MKKMKHMFYVLMFASFLLLNNITDINAMDANIPSTGGTEPPSSHKDVIVTDSTEMIIGNEYTDCIIGHSAKIYKFTLNKPGRVKIEISGKCDQDIEGTSVVNGFSLGYSTYEWSYFAGDNFTPVNFSKNIFTEQFSDDKSIKTDSEGMFSASYNFWLNKGTNYICFFHRTDNTENKTEYTLKTSFEEMQEISRVC